MGRCFLYLLVSGGNEKYINEKKAIDTSIILSNFATANEKNTKKENTMKFTTLLTIIIVGYVIYYAYQIIHDLFFAKGSIIQDELEIEEEVDISGEAGKYKPTEVHRSDIPISTPVNDGSSSDDELVSYNGGMSIDELCDTLDREHEAPNTTSLRDILSTEYSPA